MSKTGRPPSWNLTSDTAGLPWRETVFLTSKNRLIIPAQVRHRVEWLGGTSGVIAFAKLEEENFATVWPWAPKGELVKQRASEIPNLSEEPADRELMALAIQSRYVRPSLEASGRNVLPADLIAHIDPDIRDGAPLCIIGYADHFELMSQNYWQERRRNELDDVLPDRNCSPGVLRVAQRMVFSPA